MNIRSECGSYVLTVKDGIELTIDADNETYATLPTLHLVDENMAREYGEERLQLLEGTSYSYELPSGYILGAIPKIVKENRRTPNRGRITPGIYVGRLPLIIIDSDENEIELAVEIRSVKTEYRQEYRKMLEDITDECTDLLMIHSSPVTQRYDIDYAEDSRSLYQKFAFVKSVVDSEHFRNAVQRVISMPVTAWANQSQEYDIRRSRKIGASQLRQISSRSNRIAVPSSHTLYSRMKTVPASISSTVKIDTVDTPENRFIKHALTEFRRFCGYICREIERKESNADKRPHIYHEALALEEKFGAYLHHSLFSDVSDPTSLALNSPILQRKEGYRDILRVWLMFDLAAKLTWQALDDTYNAGKRDVATLYEYWLFFKLLRMFEKIFQMNSNEIKNLIQPTKDGLGLQLKSGKHTAINGVYSHNGRDLSVKFSFNRTFGKTTYPKSGSWTQNMRPDYTLSLWPSVFSEVDAEEQELIVHVHFDAKYKVENLKYLSNDHEIDIDDEKMNELLNEEKIGTYKRADLLKMHAYKDAIRRTVGAYVLYPGTKYTNPYKGFHEIVPGLGAFPISPSDDAKGLDSLEIFIAEIVEHFSNRASQREQLSYYAYGIHKSSAQIIQETMPEYLSLDKTRIAPPTDSTVLVGYYNDDQYKWIEDQKLYNIRIDPKDGLIDYGNNIMGAKYLLLHGKEEIETSRIWEIIGDAPELISKKDLVEQKNYPRTPNADNYFLFKLKQIENIAFNEKKWDLSLLPQFKGGRQSSRPFAVTLSELFIATK